ncbi:hypothetical protein EML15_02055 [Corynebacterium sp. sy017]|uniref:hypothetical protein n=1 Tax=unclassified Corynebacterium TaxID=2624378 RepID=UPI0011866CCF|nr:MULTISPECIES: hypothetical protein [unclassified Corynebacterium]MBP3087941.1 hypothetical protein [Corynebacterium sp. sy017]TSD92477.1 hypothetical protein ELY17_02055 [Corynebacterium sp. SY003]
MKSDRFYGVAATVALVLFCVVGIIVGEQKYDGTPPVNGDMVGQEEGETLSEYVQRAAQSLAHAQQPAFAFVYFRTPVTAHEAAQVVENAQITRVNAAITVIGSIAELPEPSAGVSRQQLLEQQLKMRGYVDSIRGFIVYDDGDSLRQLAKNEAVLSIEVLPEDARWGFFGIRPIFHQN